MATRWDPWEEFMSLKEAMDRLLEESFVLPRPYVRERLYRLPVDVYTTADAVVINAPMAGVKPEDVDITIEGDTVTIKGEVKPPAENVDYLIQERRYGPFSRTIRLNIPVEPGKAEATFDNGLLVITIPKAEAIKPKAIKVVKK